MLKHHMLCLFNAQIDQILQYGNLLVFFENPVEINDVESQYVRDGFHGNIVRIVRVQIVYNIIRRFLRVVAVGVVMKQKVVQCVPDLLQGVV